MTLEDLATIQSNLREIEKTGWFPPDHIVAPCVLLTDLKAIFTILQSNGQRVAYLRRRAELYPLVNTVGDEMDHLGLFLKTAFALGPIEASNMNLQLVEMSSEIDKYFTAREHGIVARKPSLRITKPWLALCNRIESRQFYRWTEAVCMLLSLSYEEQAKAERMFNVVKRDVRRNGNNAIHRCFVVVIPMEQRSESVVLFAFREQDFAGRKDRMHQAASSAFDTVHVSRCIVIAVNVDRPDQSPYSSLAVFFKGENDNQLVASDLLIF